MFWEHATIRQLVRMITRPKYEGRPSAPGRVSGDRCGCCPACQAFVRIGPEQGGAVPCPSCGRPIGSLDALWPGGPGAG